MHRAMERLSLHQNERCCWRGCHCIRMSGEFAGVGAGQRELYAEVIPWCCGKRLQKAGVIEE